ncbi:MAG: hypothetical protein N3B01_08745, partial [Verrucomicrobiae bacterium]|nr:hypothetical protein [Verrucomicrobiae bacterium]
VYERVDFYTACATQAVVSLPIYARFVGDVVLNREEIYWAIVNRAMPGTRTFRVKGSDPSLALSISNLSCTIPGVEMKATPLQGESGYEVTLELRRVPRETVRGEISFETNAASQPRITLPITINVLRF